MIPAITAKGPRNQCRIPPAMAAPVKRVKASSGGASGKIAENQTIRNSPKWGLPAKGTRKSSTNACRISK
jgi:hypothetical protein